MRLRKYYIGLGILLLMITIMSSYHYMKVEAVKEGYSEAVISDQWDWIIAEQVNKKCCNSLRFSVYWDKTSRTTVSFRHCVRFAAQRRILLQKGTKPCKLTCEPATPAR